MKNHINKLAKLFLISIITLNACNIDCTDGSGNQITEKRNVGDFEKIDLSGSIKLEIIQDGKLGMEITADDNIIPELITEVSDGVLKIGLEGSFCNTGEINIVLHTKQLNAIDVSGASEIISNTVINSNNFKLDLSGSSAISLKINTGNMITEASGASTINLIGQARKHDMDMSGATKLNALDFVVSEYNIESSGASNCKINVLTSLSANTSGASEIIYKGNPKQVDSKKSGSSIIEKFE